MITCLDFNSDNTSRMSIKQIVVHWTTGASFSKIIMLFILLISFDTKQGLNFLISPSGKFQLECPRWLKNIRIFIVVSNFPCIHHFQICNLYSSYFPVFIYKMAIHTKLGNCPCLQQVLPSERVDEPNSHWDFWVFTITTIIDWEGDKFSQRAFHEFFHWWNIKCHSLHLNIT